MASPNAVGWFEIPVNDMERAMKFYETVFAIKLERHDLGPLDMAWFRQVPDGAGATGSLVRNKEWYRPSADGVLIYFTAHSGDLANELARVEAAGGTILAPKKMVSPDHGYMALCLDSEGNRIAIHSKS